MIYFFLENDKDRDSKSETVKVTCLKMSDRCNRWRELMQRIPLRHAKPNTTKVRNTELEVKNVSRSRLTHSVTAWHLLIRHQRGRKIMSLIPI